MNRVQPQFEGTLPRNHFFSSEKPESRPAARQPTDWRTVALVSVLVAGVVSTEAIIAWKPATPVPAPIAVVEPTPIPTPVPVPIPVPSPAPVVLATPRAELVPSDVRRALPVEGAQYRIQMPGGEILNVTYRGEVPSFDQLPRIPNLNDCYLVASSKHSWVFMQPAGFSGPAWVDP